MVSLDTREIPFSAKFSRRINFAVFTDSSRTAKIKLLEISAKFPGSPWYI